MVFIILVSYNIRRYSTKTQISRDRMYVSQSPKEMDPSVSRFLAVVSTSRQHILRRMPGNTSCRTWHVHPMDWLSRFSCNLGRGAYVKTEYDQSITGPTYDVNPRVIRCCGYPFSVVRESNYLYRCAVYGELLLLATGGIRTLKWKPFVH